MKSKYLIFIAIITWISGVALLFYLATMTGCQLPEEKTTAINLPADDPVTTPIPDPTPDPDPDLGSIKYMTYDGQNVKFVYDTDSVVFKSGKANYVSPGVITVDDVLYYLDPDGNILNSYRLPCIPDAVNINDGDVWTATTDGSTSTVYKNSSIPAVYQWVILRINVTYTGDVIAETTGHIFYPLEGSETNIKYAANGGVYVFGLDTTNKMAIFRGTSDYNVSWGTNYFWRATGWLLVDGLWISSNGYTWNEMDGLKENANALWTWNAYPYPVQDIYNESPIVIPASVRLENSENVTYWIECNTGYLMRYTKSLDLLETVLRVYPGDGKHITGYALQYSLQPVVIGDHLYFHYGGFLYDYDFIADTSNVLSQDMQIWEITQN